MFSSILIKYVISLSSAGGQLLVLILTVFIQQPLQPTCRHYTPWAFIRRQKLRKLNVVPCQWEQKQG